MQSKFDLSDHVDHWNSNSYLLSSLTPQTIPESLSLLITLNLHINKNLLKLVNRRCPFTNSCSSSLQHRTKQVKTEQYPACFSPVMLRKPSRAEVLSDHPIRSFNLEFGILLRQLVPSSAYHNPSTAQVALPCCIPHSLRIFGHCGRKCETKIINIKYNLFFSLMDHQRCEGTLMPLHQSDCRSAFFFQTKRNPNKQVNK